MDIQLVKDAALLLPLSRQLQQLHQQAFPHIFKPFDEAAVATYFNNCIADDTFRHYAAFEEGMACGYIQAQHIIRPESAFVTSYNYIHIHQLIVGNENRQKGIATALVDKVFAFACEMSIERIDLTVWNFNDAAHSFFQKTGFTDDLQRMYINLP